MVNHTTIIGPGAVGMHLAKTADELIGRDQWKTWLASIPDPPAVEDEYDVYAPPLIILAVPYSELDTLVADLATALESKTGNRVVAHTNGSAGLEILAPLRRVRCWVGAVHPFQTFSQEMTTNLEGTGWGVECDDVAWPILYEWITDDLGGMAHRFTTRSETERHLYHAAAVAASNLMYASIHLSRQLAHRAGIPPSTFLSPILEQTIQNASAVLREMDTKAPFPITGPLARGEISTITSQIEALTPDERRIYSLLSLALLEVLEATTSGKVADSRKAAAPSSDDASATLRNLLLSEIQKEWEGAGKTKGKR